MLPHPGTILKKIRILKGVNQSEVAEAIGVTIPYISFIEKGTKNPTLETLEKLCRFYEFPLVYLFVLTMTESDVPEGEYGNIKQIHSMALAYLNKQNFPELPEGKK
jgi:transcriptional regulator with XRE-family HTH domain